MTTVEKPTGQMLENFEVGILFPEMPSHLGAVVPFADRALDSGARLWFGHSTGVCSMQTMAALIGRGYTIPYGSAVALHPLWHWSQFAVQARSIAQLSGHSYIAGVGPGSVEFQGDALGKPLVRPVAETELFVSKIAGAFGNRSRGVETGVGVLRPSMARCAGRSADWAITWLTPGSYVRDSLVPAMREAAAQAERAAPRVAMVVHVAVARTGRDPFQMALDSARAHLQAPHYIDMLCTAGLEIDASDPVAGARELVRSGTYVYGSPSDIAEHILELRRGGVDEVVLNSLGPYSAHGVGDALNDLDEITEALSSTKDRALLKVAS